MSAAATRRAYRRALAAALRDRRRSNRAHRDATTRVKVSDFLTTLGMSEEDIDRYGSVAGRYIAREYRAAHDGHNPRTTRKRSKPCKGYPNGRWLKVFAYRADDPALIAGARKYKRTADYVPAAAPAAPVMQLPAPRPQRRLWARLSPSDLYVGDLVRLQLRYEGEKRDTDNGDTWAPGMPEIRERWYVEDISRNGWITLARERYDGGIFQETGERTKVRGKGTAVLVALSPDTSEYDAKRLPDWARAA